MDGESAFLNGYIMDEVKFINIQGLKTKNFYLLWYLKNAYFDVLGYGDVDLLDTQLKERALVAHVIFLEIV